MKTIITNNVMQTNAFAKNFAKKIKPKDVICLVGDLGTGKTTITKTICSYFGIEDVISPTFNILKEYKVHNNIIKKIYHFDLYRIKNIDELYNIGFEEYINSDDSITIIEWPDIAYDIINNNCKKIYISYINNNEREISYEE